MSEKTYWKTVIQVEILSENGPVPDGMDLDDIAYEIIDGDWSGQTKVVETKQLSAKEAADALIEQDSDPEFFGLDEAGKEVE
jgi:hypothetical protein